MGGYINIYRNIKQNIFQIKNNKFSTQIKKFNNICNLYGKLKIV